MRILGEAYENPMKTSRESYEKSGFEHEHLRPTQISYGEICRVISAKMSLANLLGRGTGQIWRLLGVQGGS